MALDRLIGVHHFLTDRAPRDVPVVEPRPRRENPYRKDGKAIVSRVRVADLRQSISRAIGLLGPLRILPGASVFVKPNFNSPDPYPASTDLEFLRTVLELLRETGVKITMGESAGGVWRPTVNVFRKLGLYELTSRLGVKLIAFEEAGNDWVRIPIKGDYLEAVTVPRSAYEADYLVYLPCMKTHRLARFSGSLKLVFGFVHPGERRRFHRGHLEQKLGEANLCWQPDLIMMDGRKSFVTGGPTSGKVVEPGILLASGDQVAIDVEGISTLLRYGDNNRLVDDPYRVPQVATALRHGIGSGRDGYIVVE